MPDQGGLADTSVRLARPRAAFFWRGHQPRTATGLPRFLLNRFTEVFTRYIDSGFGLLGGEVAFLASTLIVIDVTLAGLFWAWGADEDVLAHLVKKTLYVGFFAFLIGNFNALAKIIFNSFTGEIIGKLAAVLEVEPAELLKLPAQKRTRGR